MKTTRVLALTILQDAPSKTWCRYLHRCASGEMTDLESDGGIRYTPATRPDKTPEIGGELSNCR
jgi:hypothetical protein